MGAAECISALSMKFEPFLAIIQLFLPDFEKNPSLTQFAPQSRLGFFNKPNSKAKHSFYMCYVYLLKVKSKGSVIEFSLVTSDLFCYYFA